MASATAGSLSTFSVDPILLEAIIDAVNGCLAMCDTQAKCVGASVVPTRDTGSVTENGVTSGVWHYFYPGQSGGHSDQWFTHDLAGPDPVDFSMWVNSPVAASITVNGVGPDDFYVRVWDMSPAVDNYFALEYFELAPAP